MDSSKRCVPSPVTSPVLGSVERHPNVALGSQVVNLIRLNLAQELRQDSGIGEVPIVKQEPRVVKMGIMVEVIDPLCIERGRSTDDAVNLVSFSQEKLGQVGTILTGDASNQCFFHFQLA